MKEPPAAGISNAGGLNGDTVNKLWFIETAFQFNAVRLSIINCQLNQICSGDVSSRNSSEMHHAAESATRIYTIRLMTAPCPPKNHATRSKLNIPTRPQLIPPIISSVSASLSIHIKFPPFIRAENSAKSCPAIYTARL